MVAVAIPGGTVVTLRGPARVAPILGALLLATAELAFWSIERAVVAQESSEVGVFRVVWPLGLGLAGCGAGLVVSAVADIPVSGGFDLTALGSVAAIGVAAGLLWLGRDAVLSRPHGEP